MVRHTGWLVLAAACCLLPPASARAYVDLAPTLGQIVRQSQVIAVAEVGRFNPDKGVALLKKVRDLKGELGGGTIRHQLRRANEAGIERPILEWAEPGRRCVLFVSGDTALVCVGEGWYQVQSSGDGWWRLGAARPDLPLAYYGTVSRLADAVARMLAGKTAIITTLPHGADREGASFELALNRASLPGLVKVQRLRASLAMPPVALAASANPAFVVGPGRAGREEVPALRRKLHAADAVVRAESAGDLGSLGPDAAAAAADLDGLLADAVPGVRMAAASALLRVQPGNRRAADVLARGLTGEDAGRRRAAARAAGLAGAAAAPLAEKLGALLDDPDVRVRRTALQALATLGPAAAGALEPVTRLLGQPETAVDAADALGRMGPAARPALKALARLLSAPGPAERWAAVRAMAQIGGEGAAPAVPFMVRELNTASEVDAYNMLIYLALLGPVAREAIPAVERARIRNPVLRQITVWAIRPDADLSGFGPMGDTDIAAYIMDAYVHDFGDRLEPLARPLARRILAGSAATVPGWAYKVLARFPEESLAVLAPALADRDRVRRERAAVALGYMGRAAAATRPQVAQALRGASDEREQRLLQWCLREMD